VTTDSLKADTYYFVNSQSVQKLCHAGETGDIQLQHVSQAPKRYSELGTKHHIPYQHGE